ncbi:hypothetical protein [Microvirga sp. VF16]|uniref:hypothetical protein n=1 Tax=Microvirga sp. VF16 TaxID=2807101 RepID=UPI00193E8F85|nr:hypothetical protein [Microvirga sp. VF16]QRM35650.1 hypothetical protein JO965_43290 [Microvirga sp. VF16]
MGYQIEHVARAFYDNVHDGKVWDNELDIIKEEFRLWARDAIALLHQREDGSLVEAFYSVATSKDQVELSGVA